MKNNMKKERTYGSELWAVAASSKQASEQSIHNIDIVRIVLFYVPFHWQCVLCAGFICSFHI